MSDQTPPPQQPPEWGTPPQQPGHAYGQPPQNNNQGFGPPPPGAPPQQGFIPQQYAAPKQGMPTWAIVLLSVLGVFVLLFVGCGALIAFVGGPALEQLDTQLEESREDATAIEAVAEITTCENTDGGNAIAEIEFTSPAATNRFVNIEIQFLNSSGAQLGRGFADFENVAPGETVSSVATAQLNDPTHTVSCSIANVSAF